MGLAPPPAAADPAIVMAAPTIAAVWTATAASFSNWPTTMAPGLLTLMKSSTLRPPGSRLKGGSAGGAGGGVDGGGGDGAALTARDASDAIIGREHGRNDWPAALVMGVLLRPRPPSPLLTASSAATASAFAVVISTATSVVFGRSELRKAGDAKRAVDTPPRTRPPMQPCMCVVGHHRTHLSHLDLLFELLHQPSELHQIQ